MDSKRLFCKQCSLCFTQKSIFQTHIAVVHNQDNSKTKIKPKLLVVLLAKLNCKKFTCSKCNSNFAMKNQMINHSKSVHNDKTSNEDSSQGKNEKITSKGINDERKMINLSDDNSKFDESKG